MAFVFNSPKYSLRASVSDGGKMTFGSLSQTGATASPQDTAIQLNKLAAIAGLSVLVDSAMNRTGKEEVVSDGE